MMNEKLESFNKKQQIGKTEILDFKSTVEKSTGYSQQKTANYRGKVWQIVFTKNLCRHVQRDKQYNRQGF